MILTCDNCKDDLTTSVINKETLHCEKCGGMRSVKNPKSGAPKLCFTDYGTGKKVVK